jgi:hypothetical protein
VCVVLAFGGAFLIGRAVDHQDSSRPAGGSDRAAATHPAHDATHVELAGAFVPASAALRLRTIKRPARKRKHKPRHTIHHAVHRAPAASSPATTGGIVPTPSTDSTPAPPTPSVPQSYTPPAPSSGSGSSGAGTTSVGGHSHHGSGTTSVG